MAKPSADDLYSLGACQEALGDVAKAKEHYAAALKAGPQARANFALARLAAEADLALAEKYFAEAIKLEPESPEIGPFHLMLARAHSRKRAWAQTVPHLEKYLAYTKALLDRAPGNSAVMARHASAQSDLDRTRRFAALTGKAAPALKATGVAQGGAADLGALKGKVVLVDFCALWAEPSRNRMARLKELHEKYGKSGLEVVGVTLNYQHKYDPAADKVAVVADLAPDQERAGIAEYAKKHGLGYRLATVDKAVAEQYGVNVLPHTVALDKQGNVRDVLRSGTAAESAELEETVKKLLAGS